MCMKHALNALLIVNEKAFFCPVEAPKSHGSAGSMNVGVCEHPIPTSATRGFEPKTLEGAI